MTCPSQQSYPTFVQIQLIKMSKVDFYLFSANIYSDRQNQMKLYDEYPVDVLVYGKFEHEHITLTIK